MCASGRVQTAPQAYGEAQGQERLPYINMFFGARHRSSRLTRWPPTLDTGPQMPSAGLSVALHTGFPVSLPEGSVEGQACPSLALGSVEGASGSPSYPYQSPGRRGPEPVVRAQADLGPAMGSTACCEQEGHLAIG